MLVPGVATDSAVPGVATSTDGEVSDMLKMSTTILYIQVI